MIGGQDNKSTDARTHAQLSLGGCPREDWGLNGYVMTVSETKGRCVVGLLVFLLRE